MRLQINGTGVVISDTLWAHTQERICLTLHPYHRLVSWVAAEFTLAEAGDVCCQIDVWLHGIGAVTVRHMESDAIEAASMAALRLREAVRRRLAKRGNPHLHPHIRSERPADGSPLAGGSSRRFDSWSDLTWPADPLSEVTSAE